MPHPLHGFSMPLSKRHVEARGNFSATVVVMVAQAAGGAVSVAGGDPRRVGEQVAAICARLRSGDAPSLVFLFVDPACDVEAVFAAASAAAPGAVIVGGTAEDQLCPGGWAQHGVAGLVLPRSVALAANVT